jgi:hypothetical protein
LLKPFINLGIFEKLSDFQKNDAYFRQFICDNIAGRFKIATPEPGYFKRSVVGTNYAPNRLQAE